MDNSLKNAMDVLVGALNSYRYRMKKIPADIPRWAYGWLEYDCGEVCAGVEYTTKAVEPDYVLKARYCSVRVPMGDVAGVVFGKDGRMVLTAGGADYEFSRVL